MSASFRRVLVCFLPIIGVLCVAWTAWVIWPRAPKAVDTSELFTAAAVRAESARFARAQAASEEQRAEEQRAIHRSVLKTQLARSLHAREWRSHSISELTPQEAEALRQVLLELVRHNPSLHPWVELPRAARIRFVRDRGGLVALELEGPGLRSIVLGGIII
jgi:hypothetical protein